MNWVVVTLDNYKAKEAYEKGLKVREIRNALGKASVVTWSFRTKEEAQCFIHGLEYAAGEYGPFVAIGPTQDREWGTIFARGTPNPTWKNR